MQPVVKDNAVSAEVADFILTLIQGFTKTGYYMPDHPETEKATSGLYDMLQHVLKDRRAHGEHDALLWRHPLR